MAAHRDKIIGVLDVGTSKVCCFIARLTDDGGYKVIGIGHQVSTGMKAGVVVDMEETERSIRAAVDAAERMAGLPVDSVYVSVTGGGLQSEIVAVDVAVAGHEIGQVDMQHALDSGRAAYATDGREVIHAIPVSFSVDGAEGIRDPRGLVGERLGINMHIVTAAAGPVRNLEACVNRGHLNVAGLVAAPYASGLSVLVEDEKALGTILLDMGGGTTSIAVFMDGAFVFTDTVPVGGQHVTTDIARGLLTPIAHAERLKTLYGSTLAGPTDDRDVIDVPQLGEADGDNATSIPRSMLVRIIRPRIEETLELVRERLVDSGFDKMAGRRLVLTGGAAQLPGVRELAARILDKKVRIGQPAHVNGLADVMHGPAFSASVGLLNYATSGPIEAYARPDVRQSQGRLARVGRWLRENF
jgi:cell division protein FtsA